MMARLAGFLIVLLFLLLLFVSFLTILDIIPSTLLVLPKFYYFFSSFSSSSISSTNDNGPTYLLAAFSSNKVSIQNWQIRNIHHDNNHTNIWFPTTIPSTVVHTLIANGLFLKDVPTLTTLEEKPYFKNVLSTIPDIHITGPDYYTYYWRPIHNNQKNYTNSSSSLLLPLPHPEQTGLRFHFLRFHGISFRSKLFYYYNHHDNNRKNNDRIRIGNTLGMWKRHTFDITNYITPPLNINGIPYVNLSKFQLLIYPPTHYGIPTSFCPPTTNSSSSKSCGQGGNHELAKDAGAMQFAAGWDWVQGIPDRLTGIFDKVEFISTGAIQMSDSFVETVHIIANGSSNKQPPKQDEEIEERVDAILRIETRLTNIEEHQTTVGWLSVTLTSREDNNKVVLVLRRHVELQGGESHVVEFTNITLIQARLWWNWQYGSPSLYDAEFTIEEEILKVGRRNESITIISDREHIHFGIRTTSSYIDERTGGRAFSINGVPIFLQGGNWIATDAMLRFSDDPFRYSTEVLFHKLAGLNILRVWGGGLTERTEFYNACDRFGMLVYQEFWMTGDNNGRWGGEYSNPLNYDSYLAQASDMIKMIRKHPSLLFYGGGNEIFPQSLSPPPYIAKGLKGLVRDLDKTRFLILSSMDGGRDGGVMSQHDPTFALAAKDGPYNFLSCSSYYAEANPGLINGSSITISFQPEVGSSSFPRFLSLKRMGLADDPLAFPSKCDAEIPEHFSYHNYQGYCLKDKINEDYDAVYAYGSPRTLQEWTSQAQLAAHQQYQCLFEGFTSKMFNPKEIGGKSAIFMWKTQSPWPSMRGFLYDWFLDGTGAFNGVLAGTGGVATVLHPQLDLSNLQPQLVNRGRWPLLHHHDGIGTLTVEFFTKEGKLVGNTWNESINNIQPMTIFRGDSCAIWPDGFENATLFVRISLTSSEVTIKPTWYWLRDPLLGPYYDFKDLGKWRDEGPFPQVKLDFYAMRDGHEKKEPEADWRGVATISVSSHSKALAFQPSFTLFFDTEKHGNDEYSTYYDRRVLPSFFHDIPPVLLPGEQATIHIDVPKKVVAGLEEMGRKIKTLQVELWAGYDILVPFREDQ